MPKKFIKRLLPDHHTIREHKNLQFLGDRLHDPNLWHLNRRSVSNAFAIGLFTAFIPTPGQMLIAAALAIYLTANLPISVVLVWVSNPLTMPPLFYFAYRVGLWVLRIPPEKASAFHFSPQGLLEGLGNIWQPFLLGCLLVGAVSAITGYVTIRITWRILVAKKWSLRKRLKSGQP